jgi:hypothetical protein
MRRSDANRRGIDRFSAISRNNAPGWEWLIIFKKHIVQAGRYCLIYSILLCSVCGRRALPAFEKRMPYHIHN